MAYINSTSANSPHLISGTIEEALLHSTNYPDTDCLYFPIENGEWKGVFLIRNGKQYAQHIN